MTNMKDFSLKSRRNEVGLIRDFLRYLFFHNGDNQTEIMYKVNLSHPQLRVYVTKLLELGFIDVHHNSTGRDGLYDCGRKNIFITEKGLEYLLNLLISEKLTILGGENL